MQSTDFRAVEVGNNFRGHTPVEFPVPQIGQLPQGKIQVFLKYLLFKFSIINSQIIRYSKPFRTELWSLIV